MGLKHLKKPIKINSSPFIIYPNNLKEREIISLRYGDTISIGNIKGAKRGTGPIK